MLNDPHVFCFLSTWDAQAVSRRCKVARYKRGTRFLYESSPVHWFPMYFRKRYMYDVMRTDPDGVVCVSWRSICLQCKVWSAGAHTLTHWATPSSPWTGIDTCTHPLTYRRYASYMSTCWLAWSVPAGNFTCLATRFFVGLFPQVHVPGWSVPAGNFTCLAARFFVGLFPQVHVSDWSVPAGNFTCLVALFPQVTSPASPPASSSSASMATSCSRTTSPPCSSSSSRGSPSGSTWTPYQLASLSASWPCSPSPHIPSASGCRCRVSPMSRYVRTHARTSISRYVLLHFRTSAIIKSCSHLLAKCYH